MTAYSDNIPETLIKQLTNMLDEKLNIYDNNVAKLFYIQYAFFEKMCGEWTLYTLLDVGPETLSDIHLTLNEYGYTNFYVYSTNPNYDILHICNKLDMRRKSTRDKIYACDLYQDFEPRDYSGKCYTK